MALRKLISKVLLPNLERDMNSSIGAQLASVPNMVDNMLAPQVFAYKMPTKQITVPIHMCDKVYFSAKPEGMFNERASFKQSISLQQYEPGESMKEGFLLLVKSRLKEASRKLKRGRRDPTDR